MTSVEAPSSQLNNDLKPFKKMAATDNRSIDGNSMKLSNGYDIEKSITQGGSVINNSQAAVRGTLHNFL